MPAEENQEAPYMKGNISSFSVNSFADPSIIHSPQKNSGAALSEVRLSSPSSPPPSIMSPEDAPSTSPLAGEEGPPGVLAQVHPMGSPSPTRIFSSSSSSTTLSASFNLTCMTCHTHFTSAEHYAKHDCVSSSKHHQESGTGDSSGDVERFDGKIVYNPDGSAYIIDSEMSEDDAAGLELPLQEGSIEDSQKHPLPASATPTIPPIANAIYVTKNNRAFYSTSCGQGVSSLTQDDKVPDVPIVHSYRVFNIGDKESDSSFRKSDNKTSESSENKHPYEQVPVKPILMCFICKLSFAYVKSFITHAMSEHSIALMDEETELLSNKNSSAIVQNVGRDGIPRISFLEPVSPPEPVGSKGDLANHFSPLKASGGATSSQQLQFNMQHSMDNPADQAHLPFQNQRVSSDVNVKTEEKERKENSGSFKEEQGTISVKKEFSDMFDALRHQHMHASLQPQSFGRDDNFPTPQPVRTPEVSRKSPISAVGTNGRSSLSPVTASISPNNFSPMQSSLTHLTGTVIGACPEHMNGRPQGISCEKCDMILQQSRQIGGQMAFMHSRNSCKTLKCPKCNWHYKYQETLEIHMKEKHPENESSCIYCLTNQAHPRLARGETYTCGYKPYRCEVCNYSTTTKGNLSIHMQSDKHLNNMQELQNGGLPNIDGSGALASGSLPSVQQQSPSGGNIYSAPKTPTPSTTPAGGASPASHQKPKPMWRCDVCNYETNVARNLRIHMTSEKHTHNMMVLQQNVKHMQQLSAIQGGSGTSGQMDPLSLLQYAQNPAAAAAMLAGMGVNHEKPPVPEVALADLAYNQALLIQMMSGGGQMAPGAPGPGHSPGPLGSGASLPPPGHNSDHIGPHFDIGLNPESLEPPPEPVPPNPKHVFSCCVCSAFHSDSLEQLSLHLQMDRSKLNENEVLLVVAGNYICKLCSYKTNLKANFQLHCKTDKHLQKLQHVNHILEGGPRNEWKLKYLANTNPMHVRCNMCEYYTNSIHKLQLHSTHQRHEVLAMLFRHLCNSESTIAEERRSYKCMLCSYSTKAKLQLLHHIRSVRHLQMEQIHQIQRHAEGKSGTQQDIGDIFRVEESEDDIPMNSTSPVAVEPKDEILPSTDQIHACSLCSFTCESENSLQHHFKNEHKREKKEQLSCPLCGEDCSDMSSLEKHAITTHSVNSDGLQRLLLLVRLSAAAKKESFDGENSPQKYQRDLKESSRVDCGEPSPQESLADSHKQNQNSYTGNQTKDKEEISKFKQDPFRRKDDSAKTITGKMVGVDKWEGIREQEELVCGVCKIYFLNVDSLKEHQCLIGHKSPENKIKGFPCWKKGCSLTFDSAYLLHCHFKETHGGASQPSLAVSERHVYKYRCQQCSLAFKTVEKLHLHSQYHAIRDATKCLLCHRNFRSLTALQKHVSNGHPELTENERKQFQNSIVGAPIGDHAGPILDRSTTALLRKESDSISDGDCNDAVTVAYLEMEDYLNSEIMAVDNFKDPGRKYKCEKCKVAYTRQSYLGAHQKTLLHLKGITTSQDNAKHSDSNRPFKSDLSEKTTFTRESDHCNFFNNLNKAGKIMDSQYSFALDDDPQMRHSHITELSCKNILYGSIPRSQDYHSDSVSTGTGVNNLPFDEKRNFTRDLDWSNSTELKFNSANLNSDGLSSLKEAYLKGRQRKSNLISNMSRSSSSFSRNFEDNDRTHPPPKLYSSQMNDKNENSYLWSTSILDQVCNNKLLPSPCYSLSSRDVGLENHSLSKLALPIKKKVSIMHKRLLENFGFDSVVHNIELFQGINYRDNLKNNTKATQYTKFNCIKCSLKFSTVWVFKSHLEEYHNEIINSNEITKFTENFVKKYLIDKHNSNLSISTALPDNERSSREEETLEEEWQRGTSVEREKELESGRRSESAVVTTPVPQTTPTTYNHEVTPPSTSLSAVDTPTSSSAAAGVGVPQMAEMAAALNALTAAQMQQLHFNPMMMAGLGLAGLPLHLNPLAAMNLQPPLMPMLPHHMLDPGSLAGVGSSTPVTGAPPTSSGSLTDQSMFLKQQQQQHQQHQQQQQQQHHHHQQQQQQQAAAAAAAAAAVAAQQKRARTRITDDQLKILRAHFDINNSPSEDQINEMAKQSGLPPKVIKHWFRNTLFKERQRCKDSPYNFSIPPSTTLNLEEYEKTGEAKVMQINPDEAHEISSLSKPKENNYQEEPRGDSEATSPLLKVSSLSEDNRLGERREVVCGGGGLEDNHQSYKNNENRDSFHHISSSQKRQRSVSPSPVQTLSPSPVQHLMSSQAPVVRPQSVSSSSSSPLSNIQQTSLPAVYTSLSSPQPSLSLSSIISSQLDSNAMFKLSQSQASAQNSGLIHPHPGLSPTPPHLQGFPPTPPTPNTSGSSSSCSGKRANRTRFTDYQIKVLQEFFENNAYPKDDDLEYLSKLLNLSPRVIVVWFQNARQKARKVYENQPPIDPTVDENAGRFTRTPGLNYQCKKCLLVFQRYYELIRHQKTHCFKEEDAKRSAQAQAAAAQAAALYADDNSNHSSVTDSSQHSKEIDPLKNVESNFQCDKCNLTFTRFEQWREHQIVHIMNPALFLNKGSEIGLNSLQPQLPSQAQSMQQLSPLQQYQMPLSDLSQDSLHLHQTNTQPSSLPPQSSPIMMPSSPLAKRKAEESEDERDMGSEAQRDKRLRTTILPEQLDYLYQKYQIEANPSRKMLESIAQEVGLKKRVVQVWFQNTRARERKGQFRAHAQVINKKCPFCPAIFKVKSALESHLSTKHAEHYSKGDINIDALPDLEDCSGGVGNFSLTPSPASIQVSQAISSSLFSDISEDSIAKYHEEAIKRYLNDVNLTSEGFGGLKREGETPLDLSKPFDLVRPLGLESSSFPEGISGDRLDYWSDEDGYQLDISEHEDGGDGNCSFESNPTSPASSTNSSAKNNYGKRFRTQMSGIQVKLMKTIFQDYKTPTMTECEMLGREIGLAKRVIQVWFQNARAKEKKAKLALQKVLGAEPGSPKPSEMCKVCNFIYSSKCAVQDHIFTKEHIENMRKYLEKVKEESDLSKSLATSGSVHNEDKKSSGNLAQHLQMAQLMALTSSQPSTNSTSTLDEKKSDDDLNRLQLLHQMYQQMGLGGLQGSPHPLLQHAMMAGAGE